MTECDVGIFVAHSSKDFLGDAGYGELTSSEIALKYHQYPDYSQKKLLNHIQEHVNHDIGFQSAVRQLSGGIYIFGHTHVQWHAQYGDKTLINPGSCGLPLDGASGAPYTILSVEKNQIHIEERRVLYDIDKLIASYQRSRLYDAAPVWSNVILQELTSGFEAAHFFLQYVDDYANKINDSTRPFSAKTWTEAYNLWKLNESHPIYRRQ